MEGEDEINVPSFSYDIIIFFEDIVPSFVRKIFFGCAFRSWYVC